MNEKYHKPISLRKKLSWISLLYLAEGFPFGVVKDVFPVYFRQFEASLTQIGLLSLLGLPWSLKIFWAPLVDFFGRRQEWITAGLIVLAIIMVVVPFFDPTQITLVLWIVLFCFTIASATQDIAIDAYTIGLTDRGEEGDVNGVRVAAYRVGILASGSGMLIVANLFGEEWRYRYFPAYFMAALLFGLLAMSAWRAPSVVIPKEKRKEWLKTMGRWIIQPGAWAIFPFILIYKLGDAAIGPMMRPFWVDKGLSGGEIGTVLIAFGVGATILGALIGGRIASKWGIFHAVWILGLAQALSNLGYAVVAWLFPTQTVSEYVFTFSGFLTSLQEPLRLTLYSAQIFESFTAGLGTAAFLSFLMRICQKEFAATQYALLSAIFAFTRDVSGAASGWATEMMGYSSYFAFTFLLALPAYVFLPWVRMWIRRSGATETEKNLNE